MLVRPCREGGCFSSTFSDETSAKFTPWSGFFVSMRPALAGGGRGSIPGVVEHRVLMYSRRACNLGQASESVPLLMAERERSSFSFEEIFIDGDDRLEHEHGLRVPVVVVDGVEEFELSVEPDLLRSLLRT